MPFLAQCQHFNIPGLGNSYQFLASLNSPLCGSTSHIRGWILWSWNASQSIFCIGARGMILLPCELYVLSTSNLWIDEWNWGSSETEEVMQNTYIGSVYRRFGTIYLSHFEGSGSPIRMPGSSWKWYLKQTVWLVTGYQSCKGVIQDAGMSAGHYSSTSWSWKCNKQYVPKRRWRMMNITPCNIAEGRRSQLHLGEVWNFAYYITFAWSILYVCDFSRCSLIFIKWHITHVYFLFILR